MRVPRSSGQFFLTAAVQRTKCEKKYRSSARYWAGVRPNYQIWYQLGLTGCDELLYLCPHQPAECGSLRVSRLSRKRVGSASHGRIPMLVLTRQHGQEIVIGGNIRIVVVDVRGDRVRLGIEAPPSVRVDRLEIHERLAGLAGDAGK